MRGDLPCVYALCSKVQDNPTGVPTGELSRAALLELGAERVGMVNVLHTAPQSRQRARCTVRGALCLGAAAGTAARQYGPPPVCRLWIPYAAAAAIQQIQRRRHYRPDSEVT